MADPKIRAVIFDYDGTLLDTFSGTSRFSVFIKNLCFKYLKRCYLFLEILETCLGIQYPLRLSSMACIRYAQKENFLVGIATNRSALGLIRSARRSGMDLRCMDFVNVRSSVLDAWAIRDQRVLILHSRGRKETPQGLSGIMRWLTAHAINPSEVLFVGDDKMDRIAAALHGFAFVMVDRHRPDFGPVYTLIARETSEAPGQ